MCVKKGGITLIIVAICLFSHSISANAAIQAWSNDRKPIGGLGAEVYLEDPVEVTYAIGGVTTTHHIRGAAKLVKNRVDPYCYVKVDGTWYVHLYGVRTDNGYTTTGWYKESDVIESAGLDDVEGYIVYGSRGDADDGEVVQGSVLNNAYGINSSKWITKSGMGNKFHKVTSGTKLATNGLYNATTFELSKLGYKVTGWVNVDNSGKKYKVYDFSTRYNVDDFVVANGKMLKDATNGALIYLQPIWEYTNAGPSITTKDIHLLVGTEVTQERLMKDVVAIDKEDGNISKKVKIKNMVEFEKWLKEEKESSVEHDVVKKFEMAFEVEDSHGVKVTAKAKVHLYKFAEIIEKTGYVRYISEEYRDMFSSNSIWLEGEYKKYLHAIW